MRPAARAALRRVVLALVALAALLFAVQGGEYGTSDLARQRTRMARLRAAIDSLEREVDSLTAYRRAVYSDRALQERIAREQFGMVRGEKELLYRFADPADARRTQEVGGAVERRGRP